MTYPSILLLADSALPPEALDDWRRVCANFEQALGAKVSMMTADQVALASVSSALGARPETWRLESLDRDESPPPPMTSAEFVYREDGRPDWSAMWTSFCELALYGGPPHRGPEEALHPGDEPAVDRPASDEVIAELRRGIFETTGLFSERVDDCWIAVSCYSPRMAAWLCASIILENVDARCEEERLYLPASPTFRLTNEVKSVVTVLAKTNHYWEEHLAATANA